MSGHEPSPSPKILLAKPGLVTGTPSAGKFGRGATAEEDSTQLRSRLPSVASLNLLSDSWDFHFDRFLPVSNTLPSLLLLIVFAQIASNFNNENCNFNCIFETVQFLTENTDFTVIGVIGSPGVGKSTIMNQLYGFDSSSPGNNCFNFFSFFVCSLKPL